MSSNASRLNLSANVQQAVESPTFPAQETQSKTLANEVFERLRADILSTSLPPGMKLRFEDLRET
jgi:DNA-binding GntR family transcriptional regulator